MIYGKTEGLIFIPGSMRSSVLHSRLQTDFFGQAVESIAKKLTIVCVTKTYHFRYTLAAEGKMRQASMPRDERIRFCVEGLQVAIWHRFSWVA